MNKTNSFVAVVGELAGRYVIGADPFDAERLAWAIERLEYGRPSEHGQSALAAFDIASWDLIGQTLGVPIWKLLGGRFRDRVPAYANGWYQRRPRAGRDRDAGRGRRRARLSGDEARPVRRRRASGCRPPICGGPRRSSRPSARPSGPDVDLMIEMHGRFSPDTAAQVAAATRAVCAALDRGARPARERGRARAGPARHDDLDRDRRADPHDLGCARRSSRAATSTSSRRT